jgi:AcrR family transcriptional regulator
MKRSLPKKSRKHFRPEAPLPSGRKAKRKQNDQRILEAAREVLFANPHASMSAVATRAHVGISALYRRYLNKEALLGQLCFDGLQQYIAAAETALADEGEPWSVYVTFMTRIVDANTHANVLCLAGTFKPSKKLYREAGRAHELNVKLFARTKAAGVLRADVEAQDIALLFEQLAAVQIGAPERTARLRQRYLALLLDGLRVRSAEPLPGPAPEWAEINGRWD